MSLPTAPPLWRLALVAAASGSVAAAGLLQPAWWPASAAGCAAIAGAAWWRFGRRGAAAALPVLALAGPPSWAGLAGWTAAAALASRASGHPTVDPEAVTRLRDEWRDADRERLALTRHIERYPVLLDACLELSGARGLDQLAASLCARARELIGDTSAVRVFLGPPGRPVCLASLDAAGAACPRDPADAERYVASESRMLTIRGAQQLRLLVPLRGDRRSGEHEGMRGVLEVCTHGSRADDHLAADLLAALARLGGLGLAAVDLLAQARSLALRDELTGLFGQHEFLRRLDEQVASCRRHRQPLGVIMCDMDRLKAYNDRFGHPAGDQALRAVAAAVRAALPSAAVICRYGGEEFAAALPGLDAAAVATAAEQARAAIAAAMPADAPERRVTASLGWSIVASGEEGRAALARADAACYRAKAGGRDRVEAAG